MVETEEVEDIPLLRPEEEDTEVAEELDGGEAEEDNTHEKAADNAPDGINENAHDPNGKMQGQLPTAAHASQTSKYKIAALVDSEVSVVTK
jgi:hypothetical protein